MTINDYFWDKICRFSIKGYGFLGEKCEHFSSANLTIFSNYGEKK
jgi:hypothetical protein